MTTPRTAQPKPSRPPVPDDGVYYPDAHDVLPVESMFHFVPQAYMQSALETWLDDPTTLVASEMFIYYQPGNIRASVSPDVYVIPNVGSELRRSYFLWLEHEVPVFAMEIASEHTYRNDLGFKQELYERWGVQEYWRYDPERRYLTPLLQGYRLAAGRYEPIAVAVDAESGECRGFSALLNLELHGRLGWFRFLDPATGRFLPNRQELIQERNAAEARVQELEAELRRLQNR